MTMPLQVTTNFEWASKNFHCYQSNALSQLLLYRHYFPNFKITICRPGKKILVLTYSTNTLSGLTNSLNILTL